MVGLMAKPSSQDTGASERFDIEVFRPGTFTPMAGDPMTFSAEDLSTIASAYDGTAHPAPIVVGHPKTDAPAFGWIESFRYDGEAERLIATVGDVEPAFADAVRNKRYRKVSIAFFSPQASANPKPGSHYPKHLGFLGGAAPAVSGLKPVTFSGTPDETRIFEFADPGFRDVAGVLRRFRDFFIDQFGLERADEVLPSYEIDWIERNAEEDKSPSYSAPTPLKSEDKAVKPKEDDPAFAAREADFNARVEAFEKREAERRHADHDAFCETLVDEGRLLPAKKEETVALLDFCAEASDDDALSFADTDGKPKTASPVETLKGLLKLAAPVVNFSRTDLGNGPDLDFENAEEIAQRAVAFQAAQERDGITITTAEAVAHVMKEGQA